MMQFATYHEWKAAKLEVMRHSEDLFKCSECLGEGVVYSECCECGHEKEEDCDLCGGDGKAPFSELCNEHLVTWRMYFTELVDTARDLSGMYGQDFFDLMCDATKAAERVLH